MRRLHLVLTVFVLCFVACNKNDERSYAYWSNLVSQKQEEINQLTQSVPCSVIDDFEIVNNDGYYLVHTSVRTNFDRLIVELGKLREERNRAANREGIFMTDLSAEPNPPLRAACRDGKPTLIYAKDLSLTEVNAERAARYPQIQNFYADVPCTDPSVWFVRLMFTGCCPEGVAVHKTIRTDEFLELMFIYSRLSERKRNLENTECEGGCAGFVTPVVCVDGKPIVELANN